MIMVKPTRIHNVISTSDRKAGAPLDCQPTSGRPTELARPLTTPMVSLKRKVPCWTGRGGRVLARVLADVDVGDPEEVWGIVRLEAGVEVGSGCSRRGRSPS